MPSSKLVPSKWLSFFTGTPNNLPAFQMPVQLCEADDAQCEAGDAARLMLCVPPLHSGETGASRQNEQISDLVGKSQERCQTGNFLKGCFLDDSKYWIVAHVNPFQLLKVEYGLVDSTPSNSKSTLRFVYDLSQFQAALVMVEVKFHLHVRY